MKSVFFDSIGALPLDEYPRMQLRRAEDSWLCLNGTWEYSILQKPADRFPEKADGEILVPFSPESEASGVMRTLSPKETLWYRRTVTLPKDKADSRLLLHFGAVDQTAKVYVNGSLVREHIGGFTPFSCEITEYVTGAQFELTVMVRDISDTGSHSRGKQKFARGGIWYTPQSGIWQTVWLEYVPEDYISSLLITPRFDESELEIEVECESGNLPCTITIDSRTISTTANTKTIIPMPDFIAWDCGNPHLYPFTVEMGKDRVESYAAMRKTHIAPDSEGTMRLMLNNRPVFHNGLLDQGYWPESLLTPPSDEAMIFDIETAKRMGYNMLRKHIKIEPLRWYYHCDRLGMLVWQDMINGGGKYKFMTISAPLVTGIHSKDNRYRAFARADAEGRAQYYGELREMILHLRSCPCIVLWVPFNEGWGQFDAAKACELILSLDDSRPIDHASGWHDQKIGQIKSLHVYFTPYRFRRDKLGRAVVLSEFGGYNLLLEGHSFNSKDFGYRKFASSEELTAAYRRLFEEQILPAARKGLCASVYTQLTDVEDEVNGIMTYDRAVIKISENTTREMAAKLVEISRSKE